MMQQAVMVHLRLSDDQFGTPGEHESIYRLEDRLSDAIERASVGEFDGDLFGEGECILYMYGPDADRLFAVIEPVLIAASLIGEPFAIKQYGPADDPNTREERVTWPTKK